MNDDYHAPEGPCRNCGFEDELNNAGYCGNCDQREFRYYEPAIKALLERQRKEEKKEATWHKTIN